MARHKDAILSGKAHALGAHAPMVDVRYGGQQGFMADYRNYVSNARYIRRNLFPVVLETPRGFQYLDNSQLYVETLKSMVELHATTIEGLNSTLTVETSEQPLNGAGEMQEDFTNVVRERSTPTFTWPEKYGKPFNTLLESWITNLMMDPETKFPNVIVEGGYDGDLLPDFYSMSVMFIEPDPTHTKVQKAWLCTNMWPKSGGENEGRREVGIGGTEVEYSVEFSAITQTGRGVENFAQRLMDEISLTGANPNRREAYINQVHADVKAGASGYREAIEAAARSAI